MSERKATHLCSMIAVLLFSFCITQSALGQSNKPPDDKETLQALLNEVTLLRQAMQTMQRMSLDTYRSQLMVDRIRVNREDIRRLTAALNDTRDTITRTQRAIPTMIDQQKLLENQISLEVDSNKRAQLEFDLKRTRDAVEMYKSQIDPLKQREQDLATELRTEQTKLDELENRLDLLERAIESDRVKIESDKPAPKKP